jgi:hypothetical protein
MFPAVSLRLPKPSIHNTLPATVQLLAQLHSLLRWAVLAAGIAASARFAFALLSKAAFGRADRILSVAFSGVLDAQALLGLVLLVGLGLQANELPPANHILHGAAMFFALAAAHQTARWRNEPDARRFRNSLLAYCLALILVLLGIAVIVQSG